MENVFSALTDDIVLNIFNNLEEDPRHWARLTCVCTRFSSLIRDSCCRIKCFTTAPSLVTDLISDDSSSAVPPGGWSSLLKLAVCCPGPYYAGILLDTTDFGLDRELGPDRPLSPRRSPSLNDVASASQPDQCYWSLFDDLYYDTVYNASESEPQNGNCSQPSQHNPEFSEGQVREGAVAVARACKRRKGYGSWNSHLASGSWNLSREQGSKLLARQFRDDCLYICDWPGCVHMEEKRKYRLFRGVFKNFKRTRVWRTINDGNRKKLDLGCAFCHCEETWDLLSAFCLRRGFGYHDDGEPVVRAFVCENGHVSGAWTDVPMYT